MTATITHLPCSTRTPPPMIERSLMLMQIEAVLRGVAGDNMALNAIACSLNAIAGGDVQGAQEALDEVVALRRMEAGR